MFISLDLETNGTDPEKDKIIEFGAIKFDLNGNSETMRFLFNPGTKLPDIITHITGITDKDLSGQPKFEDKKEEIEKFIGDLPIIGHNIQFDTGFLKAKGLKLPNKEYDTCQLSSALIPGLPSYSLEIISSCLNLQHTDKHRALDDAIAAQELFLTLLEEFSALKPKTIEEIHQLCQKSDWSFKELLLSIQHNPEAKSHRQSQMKKPKNSPKNEQNIDRILEHETTALIETAPPHIPLLLDLARRAHPDTLIAVPNKLFTELEEQTPDSVAKIDSPSQYISLARLEQFKAKEHFENHEISALIKYLIWLEETETGLLSEIRLMDKERTTAAQVSADPAFVDPNTEKFYKKALEKDQKSPALCTHRFILDTRPSVDHLIIFDISAFTQSLYFSSSIYLKLDHFLTSLDYLKQLHPKNETIENLNKKITILFGMVGIVFEKFNDQNEYSPRAYIAPATLNSKEWNEIRQTLNSIIETSQELAKINDPKTTGYLQTWKSNLQKLSGVFRTPDLENNSVWVETDYYKNLVLRKTPHSLKTALLEILERSKNYKILSESLDLNDEAGFTKTLLGLPQNLPLHKISGPRNDLKIYLANDLPDDEQKAVEEFLIKTATKLKGNTAVLFNSKQQLKHFTLKLSNKLSDLPFRVVSSLTGSLGKTTEQFKEDPENSVIFLTPNNWNKFESQELINTLIIHKLPFDPPSDPFLMAMMEQYEDPFNELQIPKAVFNLKKLINHLVPNDQNREVLILDPRIVKRSYGAPFLENLKPLTKSEIFTIDFFSELQ